MYPFSAGRISLIFKKEKEKKTMLSLRTVYLRQYFFKITVIKTAGIDCV